MNYFATFGSDHPFGRHYQPITAAGDMQAREILTGYKIFVSNCFTPKEENRPPQKPLTIEQIINLDLRLSLENCEFCINNQNQTIKAINMTLKSNPEDRPILEQMLQDSLKTLQTYKEMETDTLQKMAEIQK